MPTSNTIKHFSDEEIARRAREIWEQEGRPEGRALEHWLEAEKRLQKESNEDANAFQVTASDTSKRSNRSASGQRNSQRGRAVVK